MKGRRLLGYPVVENDSGQIIGEVVDLVVDDDLQLKSLLVRLHKGGKHLLELHACEIENGAVHIKGKNGLKKPAAGDYQGNYQNKLGVPVVDNQGQELGVVSDLIVEPHSKQTQGLELSLGGINDFIEGRSEVALGDVNLAGSNTQASDLQEGNNS